MNHRKLHTVAVVSGGFDPMHAGHIRLLRAAAALGDSLLVGVNSDAWLRRKKGFALIGLRDRMATVGAVAGQPTPFNDSDGTACDLLRAARLAYPRSRIIFANGGDRDSDNVPEQDVATGLGIDMAWGVGGGKAASSSLMVAPPAPVLASVDRAWGRYIVMMEAPGVVVKQLLFQAGGALSYQRHHNRSETWQVVSGTFEVKIDEQAYRAGPGEVVEVPVGVWHTARSVAGAGVIMEVQLGNCSEHDIERQVSL